jgi:hypothetical protein
MIAGTLLKHRSDGSENPVRLAHHIMRGEPQDRESTTLQMVIADGVVALRASGFVRDAVHFNHNAGMDAGEVDDIAADAGLLSEMVPIGSESVKQTPQTDLRRGGGGSELLLERPGRGSPLPTPPREGEGAAP